jgi:hypothetical protein
MYFFACVNFYFKKRTTVKKPDQTAGGTGSGMLFIVNDVI